MNWQQQAATVGNILIRRMGSVNLLLTHRCNLDCPFCQARGKTESREISTDTWKSIIDNLSSTFRIFVFSGGEPLLYNGVFELVKYAAGKGVAGLFTNGSGLSPTVLEKLTPLDYLGISSDCLSPIPKYRSWNKETMRHLEQFSARTGTPVSVSLTLTPLNLHEVPQMIQKAADHGFWIEPQVVMSGHGEFSFRNCDDAHGFNQPEKINRLAQTLDIIKSMKQQGYPVTQSDRYLNGVTAYLRDGKGFRCHAGNRYLCIHPDGRIMPCQDLPPTRFKAQETQDYPAIQELVRKEIPQNCECYWDCYVNYSYLVTNPFGYFMDHLAAMARAKLKSKRKLQE